VQTSIFCFYNDVEDSVSIASAHWTVSDIPWIRKPQNARTKRALDARAPKEVEDPRVAIFVKGTHTGEILNGVMRELASFNK